MPGQTDGLFHGHGAGVDEHGDAAGSLLHHSLSNQFPLLSGHQVHFAGGATGVQALNALLDQELGLLLQRGHIHFVIRGKGSGHGRNHAIEFFHFFLLHYGALPFSITERRSVIINLMWILPYIISFVNQLFVIFLSVVHFFCFPIDILTKERYNIKKPKIPPQKSLFFTVSVSLISEWQRIKDVVSCVKSRNRPLRSLLPTAWHPAGSRPPRKR